MYTYILYIYVYIYQCVYTCGLHTRMSDTYVSTHTCGCVCTSIYTNGCVCTYTYTYVCTYICTLRYTATNCNRLYIRDVSKFSQVYSWRLCRISHNCVRDESLTTVFVTNLLVTSFPYVWHDLFIYVTWLIYMCDMTHSYVRHDSVICATRLIHMCNMTHLYVRHDSFICATRLIHMYDMTHLYVRHDSFICVTWLIHMYDMTHSYTIHTCNSLCNTSTGWRRSIGCLKLQVIFRIYRSSSAKEPYN